MKRTILLLALLVPACDDPDVHNALQTAAYSYLPDGSKPSVQARITSLLDHGSVHERLRCAGPAFGPSGFVQVALYQAHRLQDGACNARVELFVEEPPTPGLVKANASELTPRDDEDWDATFCPVTTFHTAAVMRTTWVEGGMLHVEGPGCTTAPGTTCQLPVSPAFCTGDLDAF